MNKNAINKFFKRFGVEVHGSGYITKLINQQQNKNSLQSQSKLLNGKAHVIFDVGANKGLTTTDYLTNFPNAEIHAFEPFPDYAEIWVKIRAAHHKVVYNEIGLYDTTGQVSFNVNTQPDTNSMLTSTNIGATSDKHCVTKETITVNTITLDDYCLQNNITGIDILKIDVQGAELAVLKGASALLKNKAIKLIYTETYFKEQYIDQPLFFDIALYLKQYGYYVQDTYDPFYNDKLLLWCDTIFIPG